MAPPRNSSSTAAKFWRKRPGIPLCGSSRQYRQARGLRQRDHAVLLPLQCPGDVIAIVRAATGQIVAKYSYDAWGKCTVTNATGYAVGDKNPFRYRGYYYDTETGLYYLNSRYYNPEFGRFISADGLIDNRGATSQNLFAYCGNNPVNRSDLSGLFWKEIGNWFKRISTKIEEYLTPSNIYGSTVGGASIVAPALGAALVGE